MWAYSSLKASCVCAVKAATNRQVSITKAIIFTAALASLLSKHMQAMRILHAGNIAGDAHLACWQK